MQWLYHIATVSTANKFCTWTIVELQRIFLIRELHTMQRKNELQAKQREEAKTVKFDEQVLLTMKRNNDGKSCVCFLQTS